MGKALPSALNVTIVRDDVSRHDPVDLARWTSEAEDGSLPAALWDAAKPERGSRPSRAQNYPELHHRNQETQAPEGVAASKLPFRKCAGILLKRFSCPSRARRRRFL